MNTILYGNNTETRMLDLLDKMTDALVQSERRTQRLLEFVLSRPKEVLVEIYVG